MLIFKDIVRVPIHYQFAARSTDEVDEEKILKQVVGSLTTLGNAPASSGSRSARPLPVVNTSQRDQVHFQIIFSHF